jgi:hypothetical protein
VFPFRPESLDRFWARSGRNSCAAESADRDVIEWSAEPMMPAGQNPSFGLTSRQLANSLVTPPTVANHTACGAFWRPFGHISSKCRYTENHAVSTVKTGRFQPFSSVISLYRNHMIIVLTLKVVYNIS